MEAKVQPCQPFPRAAARQVDDIDDRARFPLLTEQVESRAAEWGKRFFDFGTVIDQTTIGAETSGAHSTLPLSASMYSPSSSSPTSIVYVPTSHTPVRMKVCVEFRSPASVSVRECRIGHRRVIPKGTFPPTLLRTVLAIFTAHGCPELHARGVQDIFIACMDGLTGFREAVLAVFPKTLIQRCIVHQIRNSLKYVTWKDQKAFMADLRPVYQAATRDEAELALLKLDEKWSSKYAMAIKSWQTHWEDLATCFQFTPEIRRLIYTNNNVTTKRPDCIMLSSFDLQSFRFPLVPRSMGGLEPAPAIFGNECVGGLRPPCA